MSSINWKSIANYLLSTAAAFAAGFFSVPFVVDGATLKMQIAAGVSAGTASAISHVRSNPFKVA